MEMREAQTFQVRSRDVGASFSSFAGIIPTFSGAPQDQKLVTDFFASLDEVAKLAGWTPQQTLSIAKCKLTGIARDFAWKDVKTKAITEYEEFKRALIQRFDKDPYTLRLQMFFKCVQARDEEVQTYAVRLQSLASEIVVEQTGVSEQERAVIRRYQSQELDEKLRVQFIQGLNDKIKRRVMSQDPKTFDEAIQIATKEETIDQLTNTSRVLIGGIEETCLNNDSLKLDAISKQANAESGVLEEILEMCRYLCRINRNNGPRAAQSTNNSNPHNSEQRRRENTQERYFRKNSQDQYRNKRRSSYETETLRGIAIIENKDEQITYRPQRKKWDRNYLRNTNTNCHDSRHIENFRQKRERSSNFPNTGRTGEERVRSKPPHNTVVLRSIYMQRNDRRQTRDRDQFSSRKKQNNCRCLRSHSEQYQSQMYQSPHSQNYNGNTRFDEPFRKRRSKQNKNYQRRQKQLKEEIITWGREELKQAQNLRKRYERKLDEMNKLFAKLDAYLRQLEERERNLQRREKILSNRNNKIQPLENKSTYSKVNTTTRDTHKRKETIQRTSPRPLSQVEADLIEAIRMKSLQQKLTEKKESKLEQNLIVAEQLQKNSTEKVKKREEQNSESLRNEVDITVENSDDDEQILPSHSSGNEQKFEEIVADPSISQEKQELESESTETEQIIETQKIVEEEKKKSKFKNIHKRKSKTRRRRRH